MQGMNRIARTMAVIALGLLIAGTGCATKKYVGREVGQVDERVSGVETQVEDAPRKRRSIARSRRASWPRASSSTKRCSRTTR